MTADQRPGAVPVEGLAQPVAPVVQIGPRVVIIGPGRRDVAQVAIVIVAVVPAFHHRRSVLVLHRGGPAQRVIAVLRGEAVGQGLRKETAHRVITEPPVLAARRGKRHQAVQEFRYYYAGLAIHVNNIPDLNPQK
ncbi:MAG: hypothetical protein BWY09_02106 [Candidatus Hydrogenedentes bacterium ADurb.Bin179]|nr:MAG: hypothetical protein BWY09_02106 [Candidatus Hydrogenedentes bacterium ADurb.Bin179]